MLSFTVNNIILHVMNLLLGPALRLIDCLTNIWSRDLTVLDKRIPTNCYSFIESNCLIVNVTTLDIILFTLHLLLADIVGDVGDVTPSVVAVVTLHNIIILGLLH